MSHLRTRYRELEAVVARLISLETDDGDLAAKVAGLKLSAMEAFYFKEVARNSGAAPARKLGAEAKGPAQPPR